MDFQHQKSFAKDQTKLKENDEETIEIAKKDTQATCVQKLYVEQDQKYQSISLDAINQLIGQIEPFVNEIEPRCQNSAQNGGKQFNDKRQISIMRSIGKYMIGQIGKKILSGDLQLTRISFPIRGMIAESALQKNLHSAIYFPFYMNKACTLNDPLERMKLLITACIATFHINLSFNKPLNPILGETIQGHLSDGSQLYAEQISHHPPISAFYCVGPNNNYKYFGNYHFEASARINSITLRNKGKRCIIFKDGQKIEYNFGYEHYSGALFGTTKVETLGHVLYEDRQNNISAKIKFGKMKKKPSDYFEGVIKVNEEEKCQIYGSYMGFIEFDRVRYWEYDLMSILKLPFQVFIDPSQLESDPIHRGDYSNLKKFDVEKAQIEKEKLEEIQRRDAKLRKEFYQKRKKQTG